MRLLGDPTQALRSRLSDWAFGAAWFVLRVAPARPAAWVFERAADLVTRRNGPSIQQLRRNLARVTADQQGGPSAAELDELVRAGMRSYARYWLETFRLPAMNVPDLLSRATTEHAQRLDEALAQGRGVILALPHSGNWEVAGIWLIAQGQPFSTVAERLKPEWLYDKFVAYREGLGMEVLPLTGGPPPSVRLKARLAAGGVICLLADRDLSRNGVEVSFFGEPTRMPAGPSLLALQTGAVLLPIHVYYTEGGWGQWVGEPVELGEGSLREKLQTGTQALADAFAARIALHPTDWHMLQPLWLADLRPRES